MNIYPDSSLHIQSQLRQQQLLSICQRTCWSAYTWFSLPLRDMFSRIHRFRPHAYLWSGEFIPACLWSGTLVPKTIAIKKLQLKSTAENEKHHVTWNYWSVAASALQEHRARPFSPVGLGGTFTAGFWWQLTLEIMPQWWVRYIYQSTANHHTQFSSQTFLSLWNVNQAYVCRAQNY